MSKRSVKSGFVWSQRSNQTPKAKPRTVEITKVRPTLEAQPMSLGHFF